MYEKERESDLIYICVKPAGPQKAKSRGESKENRERGSCLFVISSQTLGRAAHIQVRGEHINTSDIEGFSTPRITRVLTMLLGKYSLREIRGRSNTQLLYNRRIFNSTYWN